MLSKITQNKKIIIINILSKFSLYMYSYDNSLILKASLIHIRSLQRSIHKKAEQYHIIFKYIG